MDFYFSFLEGYRNKTLGIHLVFRNLLETHRKPINLWKPIINPQWTPVILWKIKGLWNLRNYYWKTRERTELPRISLCLQGINEKSFFLVGNYFTLEISCIFIFISISDSYERYLWDSETACKIENNRILETHEWLMVDYSLHYSS